MKENEHVNIAIELLDILPNPVLVKNSNLEYVFVNSAFEQLFGVSRSDVVGRLDAQLFPYRQVAQCNGGDLRVLSSGDIDEATETIVESTGLARETITRKIRLHTADGQVYLVGIMHDVTEVIRANEALIETQKKLEKQALKLTELASTDSLTGCDNRRALMHHAKERLQHPFTSAAILLMDLDEFKSINDNHGHDIGDAVLCHFAETVKQLTGPQDRLARIGGEEFVLLLSGLDAEQIKQRAETIRLEINESCLYPESLALKYTVSIGVCLKEKGQAMAIEQMLIEADKGLYQAKNKGRNRVEMAA